VLLYQHGFNDFQMGYASAMAIVLLVVSFSVTLVIVLNSRKWVHQVAPR
jgi:multiple sugar transport system permease protein